MPRGRRRAAVRGAASAPGGADSVLTPGRATQVAALLALRGDWVLREELVAQLWPDADPKRGRHNLSQLVYAVRRNAWGDDVEADASRERDKSDQ